MDAASTAALFNCGLTHKALNEWEEAKKHFFKLNSMAMHNEQVLVQLAQMFVGGGRRGKRAVEERTDCC